MWKDKGPRVALRLGDGHITDGGLVKSKKVLVVDDDPIVLEVVRERLEAAGHTVVTRDNPIGTSEAVVHEEPDVVLLDVMMPGLGGQRISELLSRHARTREVSVIFHSSKSMDELHGLAHQTGALGVIPKTDNDREFMVYFDRLMATSG